MYKVALLAAASLAAIATPALAQSVTYGGTSYGTNSPIVISYTGVQYPNSTGTLTLTLTGTSGNDYNFTYSLLNTSTDPSTNISGFGFNVTGGTLDLSTTFATGTYTGISSGSISGGSFVDFCATAGPNCAGGANGGPTPGGTATGTLALEFTSLPSSITFTNPIIRMQNTGPNGNGSDIGTPGGTPPVPEPATWAMMLVGFGATGFAMRRSRRKQTMIGQIA
jgi:PEP-CTERM motif